MSSNQPSPWPPKNAHWIKVGWNGKRFGYSSWFYTQKIRVNSVKMRDFWLTKSPIRIWARLYIETPTPFHSASSRKHGNSSVIIRSNRRAEWLASVKQLSNLPLYFSIKTDPTSCRHLTRSSSKGTFVSLSSPRKMSDNSSMVIFE